MNKQIKQAVETVEKIKLRKQITDFVMLEKFQDRRWPIEQVDYIDDITKIFYETCCELELNVCFDQCDTGSDCWIQSTVYVKKMIGDSNYNVILDVDVNREFDNRDEFIETIYGQEIHARKVLAHFSS